MEGPDTLYLASSERDRTEFNTTSYHVQAGALNAKVCKNAYPFSLFCFFQGAGYRKAVIATGHIATIGAMAKGLRNIRRPTGLENGKTPKIGKASSEQSPYLLLRSGCSSWFWGWR